MAMLQCKMCGGDLEIEPGGEIAVCKYCGSKQTLPKRETSATDNERKANFYNRANHFRRNAEFDKAAGLYEKILAECPDDSEAFWALVLCRYGVEYVEDPSTKKRVPTCQRTQFTSVLADEDYLSALSLASPEQKKLYEEEANTIDKIQKGILAISKKEKPFDIFICYKETDEKGRRTQDSVLAQEIYYRLADEGYKVFFSRITLEDKLGEAYEPYIFAALNSARVMIVVGTKPEYFNAVWVKNEWSRYLSLIKKGAKKTLIPAYRDMNPYDLPDEFGYLQAQDMGKLGFMQDLIRGVKKLTEDAPAKQADEPQRKEIAAAQTEPANPAREQTANPAPFLKRAKIFLENGEFEKADEYCEKVLDIDPENAEAYFYKLLAENRFINENDLKTAKKDWRGSSNFKNALRFGSPAFQAKLKKFEDTYLNNLSYRNGKNLMESAFNLPLKEFQLKLKNLQQAADIFDKIPDWKDAKDLSQKCKEEILASKKRKTTAEEQSNLISKIKQDILKKSDQLYQLEEQQKQHYMDINNPEKFFKNKFITEKYWSRWKNTPINLDIQIWCCIFLNIMCYAFISFATYFFATATSIAGFIYLASLAGLAGLSYIFYFIIIYTYRLISLDNKINRFFGKKQINATFIILGSLFTGLILGLCYFFYLIIKYRSKNIIALCTPYVEKIRTETIPLLEKEIDSLQNEINELKNELAALTK